jgi:DNA mismatch repair ATPase MutS
LGLLGHSLGWFGLLALSLGNAVIHYRTKRKFSEDLPSIRYLGRMVRCASRLSHLQSAPLEAYRARLESALVKVSRIAPETALLSLGENNALYEYLNILFLIEVRAFHSYLKLMEKHEIQLREIFDIIGFLDAMEAAASYKAGLNESVKPELSESAPFLNIDSAAHPLLEKPVPNSVSLRTGGMLVTGSNMSGKTTFLKTIGINMLFAQTLYFCLAHKFQSSFFNTSTLIGRKDNIIEGRSYYLDEILTLLRIIRACNQDIPCLCLIDELFRGTNSVERISASAEVLLYLAKKNGLIFASTHDLELTGLVADAYVNNHFQEEIGEHGLQFNFKLREGPSETRNAIKLLRHVGYPEEITNAAEQRIRKDR